VQILVKLNKIFDARKKKKIKEQLEKWKEGSLGEANKQKYI